MVSIPHHDVNLNISFTVPDPVWSGIVEELRAMPHSVDDDGAIAWRGGGVDLWMSLEASGLQIAGTMPEAEWAGWFALLKERLTARLGYEVGEPELGYKFRHYNVDKG